MSRSLPYQAAYLQDRSNFILVEKARQTGISEYTALKAVQDCAQEGAKNDWWISTKSESLAKEFINKCKQWAELYHLGAQLMDNKIIKGDTVFSLEFTTGRRIYALSSNPDALAGRPGTVVLDEFALHKNQELLLQVASGNSMWGGQIIIISTHRGTKSVFNGLCKEIEENDNPRQISHHKITIDVAIAQGIVEKINEKSGSNYSREEFKEKLRRSCPSEEAWLEEFMCIPRDSEGQLLQWETLIQASESNCIIEDWRALTNPLYAGNDVARKSDLHCHCVVEKIESICYLRHICIQSPKEKSWAARDKKLDEILDSPIRKIQIDATGTGDKYVEDAKLRNGSHRIHGVIFTNAVKDHLAIKLAKALEEGKLKIPRDNRLYGHLSAIKKGTTATGMICYNADHGFDGHADLFWALALAYDAATASRAGAWTSSALDAVSMGLSHVRAQFRPRWLKRQ